MPREERQHRLSGIDGLSLRPFARTVPLALADREFRAADEPLQHGHWKLRNSRRNLGRSRGQPGNAPRPSASSGSSRAASRGDSAWDGVAADEEAETLCDGVEEVAGAAEQCGPGDSQWGSVAANKRFKSCRRWPRGCGGRPSNATPVSRGGGALRQTSRSNPAPRNRAGRCDKPSDEGGGTWKEPLGFHRAALIGCGGRI
jgi:hypothetical protein